MTLEFVEQRPTLDRVTRWAVGLAAIVAFAVYGVVVAAYLERTFDYLSYPFGNDYGEGPVLFQVTALAAGEPIYRPIAEAPFTVANYPPVFHVVVLAVAQLTGDPLVAGRLVSFLGALASGVLIFSLVQGTLHRDHGVLARRVGGALAALFFLTHYTVIGWSANMRVDTLALAFGLLGMQLFVLSTRRASLSWIYGLAFVLAAFAKPNMIAPALASFGTGYILCRRKTMSALTVSAVAGFAVFALLVTVTEGEFVRHVLIYNINDYNLDLLLLRLHQSLFWRGIDLVLLAAAIGYMLVRLGGRWRRQPADVPRAPADVAFMLFGGLMAASLINVAGSGKMGASVSYFLEFEAAASLLLGTLAVRLATFLRSDVWSPACWRRRVMVIIALGVLCWQATIGWSVKFRDPDWSAIAYSQQVAGLLATARGPVVSEEMVLLHRAGQPIYFQPFIMTRLARDGRWDPAPLTQAMMRGDVAFVVMYSAVGSPSYERRFPDGFRAALETRYRQHAQIGHLGVFVPR